MAEGDGLALPLAALVLLALLVLAIRYVRYNALTADVMRLLVKQDNGFHLRPEEQEKVDRLKKRSPKRYQEARIGAMLVCHHRRGAFEAKEEE